MRKASPGRKLLLAMLLLPILEAGLVEAADRPVIILLLDTSGSLRPEDLTRVQTLARNLQESLPENFEFAVFKFSDDSQLLLEKTSDAQQIEQAIGSLKPEGRYTALYDAIFDAAEYLEKQETGRKAIVLLTDGKNEGGQTQLEESLAITVKTRAPVFTVGVGRNINHRILRRIAEQSGSSYAELSATTGEALGQSIRETLSRLPPPLLAAEMSRKEGADPADSGEQRLPWLPIALSMAGVCGGLLFWRIFQLSASAPARAKVPESLDATAPAPRTEPVETALTMPVPLPAFTGEPTVRIKLKLGSLLVLDGPGAGQVFAVQSIQATRLGRDTQSEVPVQDPTVSLEHCRIVPAGVGYVLTDLGSTNGTAVNGTLVKEHVLRDRDVIQTGNTSFEFRLSEGSRA